MRTVQKTANRVKNNRKLSIVFTPHFLKFPSDVFMGQMKAFEPGEGPHNLNIHLDSTRTIQNRRQHGHALLRENMGWLSKTSSLV